VIRDGRVEELWEAKLGDESPSRHLQYFARRLGPKRVVQVVRDAQRTRVVDGVTITGPYPVLASLEQDPLHDMRDW
jgi:hypothetical protein